MRGVRSHVDRGSRNRGPLYAYCHRRKLPQFLKSSAVFAADTPFKTLDRSCAPMAQAVTRPPTASPRTWILPAAVAAHFHQHARAGQPYETCGYLVGRKGVISSFKPTPNLHPEPRTRYRVDPNAFLRLEDELEQGDEQVVGIFHSHPASAPEPSVTDREHAQPGWLYVILGFSPERPDGWLRAWEVADAASPFRESVVVTEASQ